MGNISRPNADKTKTKSKRDYKKVSGLSVFSLNFSVRTYHRCEWIQPVQRNTQNEQHINWNKCIHNSHLQFEMAYSSIAIFTQRHSKKRSIFISDEYTSSFQWNFSSIQLCNNEEWMETQSNWYIQEWHFLNSFHRNSFTENFYYFNVLEDDMNGSNYYNNWTKDMQLVLYWKEHHCKP